MLGRHIKQVLSEYRPPLADFICYGACGVRFLASYSPGTDRLSPFRISSGSSCSTSYQAPHALSTSGIPREHQIWHLNTFASNDLRLKCTNRIALRGMKHVPSNSRSETFFVNLFNLRDNPGATKQRIRVGRGDSARRGNYCGRGMKGQKAHGRKPHTLWDGGQLGFLKFPVSREEPPYEVLYNQLGLIQLVEYVRLGLLDNSRVITMKDLYDSGCIAKNIKYGVMLYAQGGVRVPVPIHVQVTACDDMARAKLAAAGGSVTRVYYTEEGLRGLIKPEEYLAKNLPLPLPAHSWHPKHDGKFDAIGAIPPTLSLPVSGQPPAAPRPTQAAEQPADVAHRSGPAAQ